MEDINDWQVKYENCKYADRLLSKLSELNQQVTIPVNINEITKGIYYAKKYHGSQMRQSGDPYYSHPIEVAYMVAEYAVLKIPKYYRTDMIITSLLHDTIEDTTLTENMIGRVFGKQIASQVKDLTRVKSYGKISAAEIIELLFQQKKKDVLFIKLFDRLHNMQTIGAKSPEKINKIRKETMECFLTLAAHLGIGNIEKEMIKLCAQIQKMVHH
ncbi:HD domain-containing protein [Rickettsia endosymbiont of Culicoides newsteadi]|uniref:HD domain-containing protein n=1 Tax=Rickettsia endosymbiont of Culicoides newsteadi TaxID=1961830 RepID=UPI000B9C1C96|nr:HD domain-containing protein [Rickettsia endosymbiont of Culicoides newsteadi]OZG31369.1 guanosine polyphosphate pyrophosphohydrolase [Rickettsia endosymbiont of Culicoides newsteadi]